MKGAVTIKKQNKTNIRQITFTAVMAALIFVFTFTFKIPLGNGYTHLGDAVIFLSAWLLGGKRAAFAGGLGAAFADLALGYTVWIVPTFIIKFLTVAVCCIIAEKLFDRKPAGYAIGIPAGAAVHIGGYCLAWALLFDKATALASLPALALQTVVGVTVAAVLIVVFQKSGAGKKLQTMAGFEPRQTIKEAELK